MATASSFQPAVSQPCSSSSSSNIESNGHRTKILGDKLIRQVKDCDWRNVTCCASILKESPYFQTGFPKNRPCPIEGKILCEFYSQDRAQRNFVIYCQVERIVNYLNSSKHIFSTISESVELRGKLNEMIADGCDDLVLQITATLRGGNLLSGKGVKEHIPIEGILLSDEVTRHVWSGHHDFNIECTLGALRKYMNRQGSITDRFDDIQLAREDRPCYLFGLLKFYTPDEKRFPDDFMVTIGAFFRGPCRGQQTHPLLKTGFTTERPCPIKGTILSDIQQPEVAGRWGRRYFTIQCTMGALRSYMKLDPIQHEFDEMELIEGPYSPPDKTTKT